MSKVDDELTRRLHGAERPVDVDAVFEGLGAQALAPRTRSSCAGRCCSRSRCSRPPSADSSSLSRVSATAERRGSGSARGGSCSGGRSSRGSTSSQVRRERSRLRDLVDGYPTGGPSASRRRPSVSHDARLVTMIGVVSPSLQRRSRSGLRDPSAAVIRSRRSDIRVIAKGLANPSSRPRVVAGRRTDRRLDTKEHDLDSLDQFGIPRAEIAVYALDGSREALMNAPGAASRFGWSPDGEGFTVAGSRRLPTAAHGGTRPVDLRGTCSACSPRTSSSPARLVP